MRIIGGKYRGRHIPVPSTFRARPTTDFAREGLFNVLSNTWDLEGISVLDLFAGTGSVGFEFASRGAGRVHMVEVNTRYARFLEQTSTKLGMKNIRVYRSEALKFISGCTSKYDIVFADPPYDLDSKQEIPGAVFEAGLLEETGWMIIEHGKKDSFLKEHMFRELRKYGSVHFSVFGRD